MSTHPARTGLGGLIVFDLSCVQVGAIILGVAVLLDASIIITVILLRRRP